MQTTDLTSGWRFARERRCDPWSRVTALALSACLIAHAALRALAHAWLGEAVASVEVSAALLLASRKTRPFGVIFGAAALAFVAMADLLTAEPAYSIPPILLVVVLLVLGKRIDGERNAGCTPLRATEPKA